MDATHKRLGTALCLASMCWQSLGCTTDNEFRFQNPPMGVHTPSTALERPQLREEVALEAVSAEKPVTVTDEENREPWPLTLREVIQLTLENSEVMRDLGARVVSAPAATVTVYDPAIQQTDPRAGVEAALSAFDAQFATGIFWNRGERTLNNIFFGGGTASLVQNTADFNAEVNKTAATGTRFALRNITSYDRNNSPVNRFPSNYLTTMQMEVRHPLLQGGGLAFNRIAGPNAIPGVYNGVLVARINTDIALADFEIAVRDHLRQVEQTYWQLYFTYRNLDVLRAGRDAALEVWRIADIQSEFGKTSRFEEAPAREQYFQSQAALQNALVGSPTGAVGLYQAERDLRMLMGIPVSDQRIIQPADEPMMAQTYFEWDELVEQALTRRTELRRQAWAIKRRELELMAARNFALMRLDVVGRYDWSGFGDDLFGNRDLENGSAARDLFTGDLQGWQMGLQLTTPVGNRIGHAAVRTAELQLARERALHREQQRQIVADLSRAYNEVERAREVSRSNYNRALAARHRLQTTEDRRVEGLSGFLMDAVLNAQQLVVAADAAYSQALVDHTLAVSGVHYSRGTYLNYLGVELAEGPWSNAAYRSAAKEAYRWGPRRLKNYCLMQPGLVTAGLVDQSPSSPEFSAVEVTEPLPVTESSGTPFPASPAPEPAGLPE